MHGTMLYFIVKLFNFYFKCIDKSQFKNVKKTDCWNLLHNNNNQWNNLFLCVGSGADQELSAKGGGLPFPLPNPSSPLLSFLSPSFRSRPLKFS